MEWIHTHNVVFSFEDGSTETVALSCREYWYYPEDDPETALVIYAGPRKSLMSYAYSIEAMTIRYPDKVPNGLVVTAI